MKPRLGVRDLDAVRVDPLVRQANSDLLGGLLQHRLVQDRDPVPAGQQVVELAEQAGADQHGVRGVDGHLHGDRPGGVGHGPAAGMFWAAGSRDRM